MICPLVFVGNISDEDCDLQGPSSVAGWLAGWPPFRAALRPRSGFACRWHVHSTADTWNKSSASSVLVGARTHIEMAWPTGPMVAVGHVRHNNKSIHCLNHSGASPGFGLIFLSSDSDRFCLSEVRIRIGFRSAKPGRVRFGFGKACGCMLILVYA